MLYTREEEGEIFKYVPVAKKTEQEEESFFAKYVSRALVRNGR